MSVVANPPFSDFRVENSEHLPLDKIDVSDPELFRTDSHWLLFARLRREAPVHFCAESPFGPYWSVTKFKDIMAVDTNHAQFSSDWTHGGISIRDLTTDFQLPMFIAMDPPKHEAQRKVVSPIFAPDNLAKLQGTIRERVGRIFDSLPRNEEFNWVDRVSIELTTQMLATLFDFPWEERRKLTRWSDVATADENSELIESEDQRRVELMDCAEYFLRLWNERVNAPRGGGDLISMLAHSEATRNMEYMEFLGNIMLLIVGGNDTTRNSLTGGLYALSKNPQEWAKLKADHSLVENMVSEIIRWQTPVAHMRRTATEDVDLRDQKIKKGDKVVMWYVSGNRDDEEIPDANKFIIDRENARHHLSFGFGIHRCVGNRLAEMQLKIVWEEILKRNLDIEVLGEPRRLLSNFIRGYENLQVRINA